MGASSSRDARNGETHPMTSERLATFHRGFAREDTGTALGQHRTAGAARPMPLMTHVQAWRNGDVHRTATTRVLGGFARSLTRVSRSNDPQPVQATERLGRANRWGVGLRANHSQSGDSF